MKKLLAVILTLVFAAMPLFAFAANSPTNETIPETEIVDITPEDEEEEVIPPEVEIIPDPEEIIEIREEMQTIYRLTIRYIYIDGRTAAPTYTALLETGTPYSVTSPTITGYTPTAAVISGVMPARDIQYLVVYLNGEVEDPIFPISEISKLFNMDDYETPLGLGSSIVNVGISAE